MRNESHNGGPTVACRFIITSSNGTMIFAEVVLKNLLARKTRAVLTILGLATGVAATISLLSIAWHFADSAAAFYHSRGVDIIVVRAGVAERINSSLRTTLAFRVRALPGVAAVDYKLTEMVSLEEGSLIGIPLHGLDPEGFGLAQLQVTSGRTLTMVDRRCILLGAGIAESLGLKVGQSIEIEGRQFQIVGLFQGVDALESNTVVALLNDVQELMDRPGQVSEFQVQADPSLADDAALSELCQQIEALRDEEQNSLGLKALPTRSFVSADMETRLTSAMAWGTSVVVVVLSVVGMFNTMLMSVLERTREIGVLRAIGWPRRRVVGLILGEALMLIAMGSLAGTAGAAALVLLLSHWSATRTIVRPDLSCWAVISGVAIALVAGAAGSLYPAYRGSSISPTEALRYE